MRRMHFGESLFSLNMVIHLVSGPLERYLGLMGVSLGILLDVCIMKWGMVPRPGFGLISGVGLAASRMDFLSYFA